MTDRSDAVAELVARDQVREAATRLFVHTDARDWPAVRACFADTVLFDMQSLTGAPPTEVAADEIVSGWRQGLQALQAVHHQVGNFLITLSGTGADVSCHGIASHYLENPSGRNTRVFVGTYRLHLIPRDGAWRIDRFAFTLKYLDGNPNLESTA